MRRDQTMTNAEPFRKFINAESLCAAVLAVFALVAVFFILGCSKRALADHGPDTGAAVTTVADGIGDSAAKIDVAREDAVAKAPQVQPESDRIGTETARLRQYQADLALAVKDVNQLRKENASLAESLRKAKEQAERERTGIFRWVFGVMAGLALLGAVAAVLWLRNMPLAITCGAVVAACIGATYLLAWAKWLAVGMLVLLAMATAYAVWRQWRTGKELVLTAEAFKKSDPNDNAAIERAAEQIQTEATKAFVRLVRDPIKKKLAERQAFGK